MLIFGSRGVNRRAGRVKGLAAVGPDADNIVFVEAALATTDKTIVTGNLADYPPEILAGARVITPARAAAELAHSEG